MLVFAILVVQGGLVGFVAGLAFPGWGLEYWATVIINAFLVIMYGIMKEVEGSKK